MAANGISSEHFMDLGDVDGLGDLHLHSGVPSDKPAKVVMPSQDPCDSSAGADTAASERVLPDISPMDDPPASPEVVIIVTVVKGEEIAINFIISEFPLVVENSSETPSVARRSPGSAY